ncbi:MAG: RNA polymerase sigma factor [Patescibacteria group bacterium]
MTLDKNHISELWDKITPKLYGYLVRTLGDKDLAQDILQTTWLKAMQSLPTFGNKGEVNFSAWLFAIARNECKQHWRKGEREIPFDESLHDRTEISTKTQDKIFIEQILSQLSKNDQELIKLRYISDLPLNNIAKILKINPVAVRVRMHRALTEAKLILKNQYHV